MAAREKKPPQAARVVVEIIFIFTVVAAVLGIATGSLTLGDLTPKIPPKSSPITVP